jgi:hypothetical protein
MVLKPVLVTILNRKNSPTPHSFIAAAVFVEIVGGFLDRIESDPVSP